jgi:hypothetical protein
MLRYACISVSKYSSVFTDKYSCYLLSFCDPCSIWNVLQHWLGKHSFVVCKVFFFAGKGKNDKFAEELKSRVSHEDEVLEAVLYMCVQTMPEAAGAVAAGAVADWLLGPREQQQLAIILVG